MWTTVKAIMGFNCPWCHLGDEMEQAEEWENSWMIGQISNIYISNRIVTALTVATLICFLVNKHLMQMLNRQATKHPDRCKLRMMATNFSLFLLCEYNDCWKWNHVDCWAGNSPGETGPPELLSRERPESESTSSCSWESQMCMELISWSSMQSRFPRPSWLIWSNTASSRLPPPCWHVPGTRSQTEAKGRAARPVTEPLDSSRMKALRCGGGAPSTERATPAVPVTMASSRLTSWLIADVMSDRRSGPKESRTYRGKDC